MCRMCLMLQRGEELVEGQIDAECWILDTEYRAMSPYRLSCRRSDPDAPLEQIKQYTSKGEDAIDSHMHWIRPWLPALGRFLIVVTFLEDALR